MVIYRYGNRKYYSPTIRGYLNYEAINKLMNAGVSFQVICHKTKNDITQQVKTSAVYYYTTKFKRV